MSKGRFITLEGIEGAGKSTQLEVVRSCLQEQGIPVITTREPGGSPIGERIRALLLDPVSQGMATQTELLLMFAARAEHIAATIGPALEQGTWVLCDRFTDATYAYQGGGRGVDRKQIVQLEELVVQQRRPDLTLLLDLSVPTGLARAAKRSAADRFESEATDFFIRVRAAYLKLARAHPERIRVIDANPPAEVVSEQVRAAVKTFLEQVT